MYKSLTKNRARVDIMDHSKSRLSYGYYVNKKINNDIKVWLILLNKINK